MDTDEIHCTNQLNEEKQKANLWTPASLFSDPTDLCLTDGTHDPVTAVLLNDDHMTCWALHRVTKLQQFLLQQ